MKLKLIIFASICLSSAAQEEQEQIKSLNLQCDITKACIKTLNNQISDLQMRITTLKDNMPYASEEWKCSEIKALAHSIREKSNSLKAFHRKANEIKASTDKILLASKIQLAVLNTSRRPLY